MTDTLKPGAPSVDPDPKEEAAPSRPGRESDAPAYFPDGEPPEAPDWERVSESLSMPPSARAHLSRFEREALAPGFFTVLFLSSIFGLFYVLQSFLSDLVIAAILVILFRRPFEFLLKYTRRPWLASALTCLLIFVVLIGPTVALAYTIAKEAAVAYSHASGLIAGGGVEIADRTLESLSRLGLKLSREELMQQLVAISTSVKGTVVALGGTVLSDAISLTLHLTIDLVLTFYFLVDGARLKNFVFHLSPLPDDEDAVILDTFRKVSRGVVIGNGLGSLLQAALGTVAMLVVGLPSPVLWGAVMAIAAFLPIVGISLVFVPASAFLFLQGRIAAAVAFFSFCMLQSLVVENVVKTRMMGSAMRMHDLLVFLSILGGLSAFGVIGIVYGPLIAMMFMTLEDLYSKRYKPQLARRFVSRS